MQKPVLTQSQATKLISFAVVLGFTVLLLVSGIVVQQRSLSSLRSAINPKIESPARFEEVKKTPLPEDRNSALDPPPPSSFTEAVTIKFPLFTLLSKFFYSDRKWRAGQAGGFQTPDGRPIRWPKLAYAQVVTRHEDVCSAVMVFADLHNQASLPGRVFVLPEEWIKEEGEQAFSGDDDNNPVRKHTISLLRRAAREFRVTLAPVPASSLGNQDDPNSFSTSASAILKTLYSLSLYDRLILLPRPGLVQDAEVLDSLIGYAALPEGGYALVGPEGVRAEMGIHLDGGENDDKLEESLGSAIVLLRPWKKESIQKGGEDGPVFPTELAVGADHSLAVMPGQWSIPSSRIFSWTGRILEYQQAEARYRQHQKEKDEQEQEQGHENTQLVPPPLDILSSAYILISDTGLMGPEYMIDTERWEQAMPSTGFQDRRVWQAVYRRWRRRRMDVCGEGLVEVGLGGQGEEKKSEL